MCKTVDLGNGNYKLLSGDKRIMDCSFVQEVQDTAFGAWEVNGKHYLFGQGAKSKIETNKITENKKKKAIKKTQAGGILEMVNLGR